MGDVRWDLLQPVDVGSQVQQGFATGMALMKRVQTQHALQAYLQNPNDPAAYNALAAFDPQAAATIQQQQQLRFKLQQENAALARRQQAGTQAAGGDIQGGMKTALMGGDTEFADALSKLDDNQKKAAADFWSKAGPVAYQLRQEPDPAKREALWQQAKPILSATGADSKLLDSFDPNNNTQLDAAIATAQKVGDLVDQGKIVWHQQGENPSFATDSQGHPIGSQNPATAGSLPHVTDQSSYDAVPPGGHYLDPNGHMRVKGGQSSASPTGGFP